MSILAREVKPTSPVTTLGAIGDRRADPRFPSSLRARLSWSRRPTTDGVEATFSNVSRGGAAVRTSGLVPATRSRVWITPVEGPRRRAMAAEVRGVSALGDGGTLIRFSFRERLSAATIGMIAGRRRSRPARVFRGIGAEPLEGRKLLATMLEQPPAVVAADVGSTSTSPIPIATSLYKLADDALLSQLLYSTPSRMASKIGESGAVGTNADWEAGLSGSWFIENQRYGADFVQAGLVRGDAELVARGWKMLDWGFARQSEDGGFAGTGDAFHSTSLFVEAAARALLLTTQSRSPDAPRILAEYTPKLDAAARWLSIPSVATKGDAYNVPYTHRRWLLASALGETAAVLRSQAGAGPADAYLAQADALDRRAEAYAEAGLALQAADGSNPEKGGTDTSYQAYGVLQAERYLTTCPSPELRSRVKDMIVRGLDWLAQRVDEAGQVATEEDTRTGTEASRSGTVKSIDYKTMIQAFSIATTITGDGSYREVARRLAVGRGWIR